MGQLLGLLLPEAVCLRHTDALPARLTKARRRDRESPPAQLRDDDRDRRGGAFQQLDDVAPRELVGIVPDEIEDGLLAGGEEVAGAGELHLLSSCRMVACCALRAVRRSTIAYTVLNRSDERRVGKEC